MRVHLLNRGTRLAHLPGAQLTVADQGVNADMERLTSAADQL